MKMFEDMADEIFKEADVQKKGNEDWHEQIVDVLSVKMATLSATMGLSYDRVDRFEEQKKALIQDLIGLKERGEVTITADVV